MRWVTLFCLFILLGAQGTLVHPQETEPLKNLMNLKLDCAKQVLEGLVKQDFKAIKELGFRLGVLAGTEDWMAIRTPEYSEHMAKFRNAVEALQRASAVGDIDATASAYADMTLSCVQCHKYVREYRTASEPQK